MHALSVPYVVMLASTAAASGSLCAVARLRPQVSTWTTRPLALVLVAITGAWIGTTSTAPHWSPATALPLALCDVATLVAAAACWWRHPLLVELTWFWGLAGSLQSLVTPDVSARFPSAEFVEYVVAHAGIVTAALLLVVGLRLAPRPHAAARVLGITAAYTAGVGLADALTGGDYMYLRQRPSSWTLLSVLGPWPWYIFGAAGVAVVLVVALDAPFWRSRRRAGPLTSLPS
ncbi:MAG TPA: TIGR02206 family membrane protein [Acidimicrobiales bacterium]|nr:TIGR02206 family membrane protein [Acidimicrobiales bacterium]